MTAVIVAAAIWAATSAGGAIILGRVIKQRDLQA